MKLFETGCSLQAKFRGRDLNYKTFVFVNEDQIDESEQEALKRMELSLKENNIEVINVNPLNLCITDKLDNIYTLSHERIIDEKFNLVRKPSSLIRFMSSRPFHKDMMYVDENGQNIDIFGKALKAIKNRILSSENFFKSYMAEPNLALEVLESIVINNYSMNQDIEDHILMSNPVKIQPINKEIFTNCMESNPAKTLRFISQYEAFSRYLFNKCGLKLSAQFTGIPNKEVPIDEEHYVEEQPIKDPVYMNIEQLKNVKQRPIEDAVPKYGAGIDPHQIGRDVNANQVKIKIKLNEENE